MILEKELLDFTNWLYDNNWRLIGDGMCLNTKTKDVSKINELVVRSKTLENYAPQKFQIGETVRIVENGDEVSIVNVKWNKYDNEYKYWYEDEEGNDWYGYHDEFESIS
jgi:hypothetical protein